MKTFALYYEKSATDKEKYVRPCGDRSIVILDGRKSVKNLIESAIKENGHRRPVYDAFAIFQGETFNRNVIPVTGLLGAHGEFIRVLLDEDYV